MNEIERAISRLEKLISRICDIPKSGCRIVALTNPDRVALEKAKEALKEKLAREQGCYGCLTPIPGFRFCSHCGRRLEDRHDNA